MSMFASTSRTQWGLTFGSDILWYSRSLHWQYWPNLSPKQFSECGLHLVVTGEAFFLSTDFYNNRLVLTLFLCWMSKHYFQTLESTFWGKRQRVLQTTVFFFLFSSWWWCPKKLSCQHQQRFAYVILKRVCTSSTRTCIWWCTGWRTD